MRSGGSSGGCNRERDVAQRRGTGTRVATLNRFQALMVTAIAMTFPASSHAATVDGIVVNFGTPAGHAFTTAVDALCNVLAKSAG
jgi:hypothetical protein